MNDEPSQEFADNALSLTTGAPLASSTMRLRRALGWFGLLSLFMLAGCPGGSTNTAGGGIGGFGTRAGVGSLNAAFGRAGAMATSAKYAAQPGEYNGGGEIMPGFAGDADTVNQYHAGGPQTLEQQRRNEQRERIAMRRDDEHKRRVDRDLDKEIVASAVKPSPAIEMTEA